MKNTELIILRTSFFNSSCSELLDNFSGLPGKDIVVCADESKGFVDTGTYPKVRMGLKSIDRLGLYRHPKSSVYCGDYFYYHVLQKYPDYDYYWMLEPDVYFDFHSVNDFFSSFINNEYDYLAMHFGKRDEKWPQYKKISAYFPRAYGGAFFLTRISRKALNFIFLARKNISQDMSLECADEWPSDESFVASSLMNSGFQCGDFNHVANGVYSTKGTFGVGWPWLYEDVASGRPSNLVYHPVFFLDEYIVRLKKHLRGRGMIDESIKRIVLDYYGSSTYQEIIDLID